MYSEWKSLQSTILADTSNSSVLDNFPANVGKEVACSVVRHLTGSLSLGAQNNEPSQLTTGKDVKWTMEVICYGLHLPLSEHEAIKECVNVYCDWLTCLLQPGNRVSVPGPVHDDPNVYGQTIIQHLHNLFLPRDEATSDQIHRQVVQCHRVLRTLETMAKDSQIISRDTWETLLRFLLGVNDRLLAPPTVKGDLGSQLCERILSVLFEVWLLACVRCFPSPSLWRTFRDMCQEWRHNQALIVQWHRINFVLCSRLLVEMYGPDYPELVVGETNAALLPQDATSDCIAQSWFRFLHTVGNPCDLAKPRAICQTTKFLQMSLSNTTLVDPAQHDCLKELPQIFLRAMRGVSVLVDSFLGMPPPYREETPPSSIQQQQPSQSSTPPPQRRSDKKLSLIPPKVSQKNLSTPKLPVASPNVSASSSPAQLTLDTKLPPAGGRPMVNSILHLFGAWLFEASLVDVPEAHKSLHDNESRSSLHGEPVVLEGYDGGRAEALGALCRIFCSHRTGEHILPQYLSRFYICLYHALRVEDPCSGLVLTNVLFNSYDLLRVDLAGVMVMAPRLLTALELVLSDTSHKVKECDQISLVELRKASIHILLSMLCLPLHFQHLGIQEIFRKSPRESNPGPPTLTFMSLKLQITELLLRALTNETEPSNTHMLLGGLLLLVLDLANYETAETTTEQQPETGNASGAGGSGTSGATASMEESGLKSKDFDTSYGLFGGATSLVCNRLMATWKSDLNIALSAMEVLSGLAKVKLRSPNLLMCKRTVKWICDFIVFQCSRPAPAHSKDLHSMIVAAFQSLTLWLVEHHYLLQDRECLHYVLEVVELGISGSKSQNRASDVPKMKGEKELMPASMRVRDAADALLTCIMEQAGSFPSPRGPEAPHSLLDEESLMKYCKGEDVPEYASYFRYFALDNSIIISLLEQPLIKEEDPLPTLTIVIRGPFGRHAWTMQLRHLPRHHKVASEMYLNEPGRPQPGTAAPEPPKIKHRWFPASVDSIPLTKADKSIPSLESVIPDKERHELFKKYIADQIKMEQSAAEAVRKERENRPFPNPEVECKQPSITHEFQTARLFLSHFGFLTLDAIKDPPNTSIPPNLAMLDPSEPGFVESLHQLDNLPSRTTDTVHVFYVKNGQKTAAEILNNVSGHRDLGNHFVKFLLSLGWPVDVQRHPGWTGNPSTSWKVDINDSNISTKNCSLFDGKRHVIYWSDVSSEIVFIVTSSDVYRERRRASFESGGSGADHLHNSKSAPNFLQSASTSPFTKSSPKPSFSAKTSPKFSPSSANSPRKPNQPVNEEKSPRADRTDRSIFSRSGDRFSDKSLDSNVKLLSVDNTDTSERSPTLTSTRARPARPPKTLSLDLDTPPKQNEKESPTTPADAPVRTRRPGRHSMTPSLPECKVFIVWLESYEDAEKLPLNDMFLATLSSQSTEADGQRNSSDKNTAANIYVIMLHPLKNGLFRVNVRGPSTRVGLAGPLVDGMVVSRRTMGDLARQTAINIGKRRRQQDSESHQPPHVRRKLKVQDITDRYRCHLTVAEFYTALFQDVKK